MPFLAPAIPFIGAGLSALGSIGKGRAAGRQAENAQLAEQQRAAIEAARFNREQPFVGAQAGVRGDILSNLQPISFTGGGRDLRISGGLSPALLSGGTRQIGGAMNRQALLAALGGGQGGGPFGQLNTAQFAPKKAGLLDKILGGAGIAGAGLGLAGDMGLLDRFAPRPKPQAAYNPAFQTRRPLF